MKNKKGFTLMEMLIVVAIIAVLVAVAMPTVMNINEKSKESVDEANLRAAYAQILADSMLKTQNPPRNSDNGQISYDYDNANSIFKAIITAQQKDPSGWVINKGSKTTLIGSVYAVEAIANPNKWTITCDIDNATVEIKPENN